MAMLDHMFHQVRGRPASVVEAGQRLYQRATAPIRFIRTGGLPMLKAMGGALDNEHAHHH